MSYESIDRWREENHRAVLSYRKRYRLNHPERVAAQIKKWKKDHREKVNEYGKKYAKKYPEKRSAILAVRRALKRGILIRPDMCSQCNRSGKIEGHHPDYCKPLDVIWLCPKCHGQIGISQ